MKLVKQNSISLKNQAKWKWEVWRNGLAYIGRHGSHSNPDLNFEKPLTELENDFLIFTHRIWSQWILDSREKEQGNQGFVSDSWKKE
jgi:hypothetical protein